MTDLEKFIVSRWMYSIGEPIIDDAEYNLLLETIKKTNPDCVYLDRTWSDDPCPTELLVKYGYSCAIKDIVLSDKSESIPSINSWVMFESLYRGLDEEVTVSYKHDGWNIQAYYYNGKLVSVQTRGRLRDSICADVLSKKLPQEIVISGRIKIVSEATVSDKNYKILQSELGTKSQRGAVSSCLARSEYTDMIDLHSFSIIGDAQIVNPFPLLESLGFRTVKWMTANNYESLLSAMLTLNKELNEYEFPTDGIVIRGSQTRAVRLMSWEESIYESYITGYEESYGPYRVGVKAKIYPIKLRNSTQTVVSVTNYQRVIDNNLRIGYPVAFRLASMAIADIDETATALLQKKWSDRYEEFVKEVEQSEKLKLEVK